MITHVLFEGHAVCGTMPFPCSNWPEGHNWVHVPELRKATCERCRELARLVMVYRPGARVCACLNITYISDMREVAEGTIGTVERMLPYGGVALVRWAGAFDTARSTSCDSIEPVEEAPC